VQRVCVAQTFFATFRMYVAVKPRSHLCHKLSCIVCERGLWLSNYINVIMYIS